MCVCVCVCMCVFVCAGSFRAVHLAAVLGAGPAGDAAGRRLLRIQVGALGGGRGSIGCVLDVYGMGIACVSYAVCVFARVYYMAMHVVYRFYIYNIYIIYMFVSTYVCLLILL